MKPVIEIDGAAFDDLEGFFDEVDPEALHGVVGAKLQRVQRHPPRRLRDSRGWLRAAVDELGALAQDAWR